MNKKQSNREFMKESMWVELTAENNYIPYEPKPKRKCTPETKLKSKIKISWLKPTDDNLKQIKQYAVESMESINSIETVELRDCPILLEKIQKIMQLYGIKVNCQDIWEAAQKNFTKSDKTNAILGSMRAVFKEFSGYFPVAAAAAAAAANDDKLHKVGDTSWLFLCLKIEDIVIASVFVFRGSKGFWELGEERLAGEMFARDGIYVPKSLGFQSITGSVPFMLCKLLFPEHQYVSINELFIPWIINYAQRCNVSRIYANPLPRQSKILQKYYGFKELEEDQKDNLVFRYHTFKNFLGMPPTVTYVLSETLSKYLIFSAGYDSSNCTEDCFDHLVGLTCEWYDTDEASGN